MKTIGRARILGKDCRVVLDHADPAEGGVPSVRFVSDDGRVMARCSLEDLRLLAGLDRQGRRRRGFLDNLSAWASILARIGQFIYAVAQAIRILG